MKLTLITMARAARVFGVHRSTILRWSTANKINRYYIDHRKTPLVSILEIQKKIERDTI